MGSSTEPGQKKTKSDGKVGKNKDRKRSFDNHEIKTVFKKLRKTTPFIPKAVQSPYAFERGKKNCETCNMDKETYKSFMKSVKVVELIVEDVINKEQKDMLDDDDPRDEAQPGGISSTKGEKKLSIQFEIYCQKDIDHNLKCVLVKLQKTVGDILLQVCYCKTKENPDGRCEKYDVSLLILDHLKFEYTNLTNNIIQLFKPPPSKSKTSDVCVACIKEGITDCTQTLEDMLRDGRNLKVTMRNDNILKDKCCSRSYPHVHALVQDRHVVLKFELPFEVINPNEVDNKQKNKENFTESMPYDEWPKDFDAPTLSEKSKELEPKDNLLGREQPEKNSLVSIKSVRSLRYSSLPSKDSGKKQFAEPKSLRSSSTHRSSKSTSSVLERSGSKTQDRESKDKFCGCNFDEVYKKYKVSKSDGSVNVQTAKPLNMDQTENKDIKSLTSKSSSVDKNEYNSKDSQKPQLKTSKSSSVDKTENDLQDSQKPQPKTSKSSSVDKKENDLKDSPQPKEMNSNTSNTDESEFSIDDEESIDSLDLTKHNKQVSFIPDRKQENVYYIGKETHSIFQMGETRVHSKQEIYLGENEQSKCSLTTSENLKSKKGRESCISAVDSVILVKNKYSLLGKSNSNKELKLRDTREKSFMDIPPQYEIKQTICTEPSLADLQRKPSKTLNKQQVSEMLGTTKLMSISFPAECCKNNKSVSEFKNISDLPFSASLHSLPLDQDDLNHITQSIEKDMLVEEIVLIPNCDEWELQCMEEDPEAVKEERPEWHEALTARDAASNICFQIQTDKPMTKKRITKSVSRNDIKSLPTIDEEDEELSRRSSLNKEKGRAKKNKSTSCLRTTDLRFFTVEYPGFVNGTEMYHQDYDCKKSKMKTNPHYNNVHQHVDRYFKINPQLNDNLVEECVKNHLSNISYNSYRVISSNNLKTTQPKDLDKQKFGSKLEILDKKCSSSSMDEMIMKNVIYLTSTNSENKSDTSINSTNDVSKYFANDQNIYNFYQQNLPSDLQTRTFCKALDNKEIESRKQLHGNIGINNNSCDMYIVSNSFKNRERKSQLRHRSNFECKKPTNFGFLKSYVSVKNNHENESETAFNGFSSNLKSRVSEKNMCEELNSFIDLEKSSNSTFKRLATHLITNDTLSEDMCSPHYGSERRLGNSDGEMLQKLDKAGLPTCDLNISPDCALSCLGVGEPDLNHQEMSSPKTYQKTQPLSGTQVILYNLERRPLTSCSGTVQLESPGKAELHFGCVGNPVSSCNGRPVYNFSDKKVVESK